MLGFLRYVSTQPKRRGRAGTISAKTLSQYVSAVKDYYTLQVALGSNNNPKPRTAHVTAFLRSKNNEEAGRRRQQNVD